MKTYRKLQREFDKKVEHLQKKCPHKRTKWMKEYWAIGHATGHNVKVCLTCNKTLERD